MKTPKKLVPILLLGVLAALCIWLGTSVTPQQLQEAVSRCGNWAVLVYVGLFTLLPAFFFPVSLASLLTFLM